MSFHSPDEQRKRIAAFLAHQRTGVICCTSDSGLPQVWAMPVWYRPNAVGLSGRQTLEVTCLVPRWADVAHHLSQASTVLLIVQATSGSGLRWLQIRGMVRPVEAPDWSRLLPRWVSTVRPDDLYMVVRVAPGRIDLVDEDVGWGVQETLEC